MDRRALLVSLALAAAGTALILVYLNKYERALSGGERVTILLAAAPIARGELIKEEDLTTQDVPIAFLSDRAVKASERLKVDGLRLHNGLEPQQMLMWSDLAITTKDRDLSTLVQPGKRGVAVRAQRSGQGGETALVKPGDYVDVFATLLDSSDRLSTSQSSVLLLQRVLVLAAGKETQASPEFGNGKSEPVRQRERLLTLSLSVEEVQLLNLAVERGRISVAVRNPEDQTVLENVPALRSSAVLDEQFRDRLTRVSPNRLLSSRPIKIERSP